jgi:hypothetical protein
MSGSGIRFGMVRDGRLQATPVRNTLIERLSAYQGSRALMAMASSSGHPNHFVRLGHEAMQCASVLPSSQLRTAADLIRQVIEGRGASFPHALKLHQKLIRQYLTRNIAKITKDVELDEHTTSETRSAFFRRELENAYKQRSALEIEVLLKEIVRLAEFIAKKGQMREAIDTFMMCGRSDRAAYWRGVMKKASKS